MRTEKRKKGGRIPKLKPKTHQVMLRFDEDEWNKFITMYEKSEVYAKAVLQSLDVRTTVSCAESGQNIGGLLHQTVRFSRSVPCHRNQLQPSCEGIEEPFLGEKGNGLALQVGEMHAGTGRTEPPYCSTFQRF